MYVNHGRLHQSYFIQVIVFNFSTAVGLRDYYMTFSISALVLARESHIKPDSEAVE
jgi:hypothetical protein